MTLCHSPHDKHGDGLKICLGVVRVFKLKSQRVYALLHLNSVVDLSCSAILKMA